MEETINLITLSCGTEVILMTNSNPEEITIEIQSKNESHQMLGRIKISELGDKAKELGKTQEELMNDVRLALIDPKPDNGFVYEMDEKKFYLKKDLQVFKITFLEVSVEKKIGDIFDIFRILIKKNEALKGQLAGKTVEAAKLDIAQREMTKLIKELKDDKERIEVETKSKFLVLLNTKKRQISELLKTKESKGRQLEVLSSDEEQVTQIPEGEFECDTDDEILVTTKKPRTELTSSSEEFNFTRKITPVKSTNVPKAVETTKSLQTIIKATTSADPTGNSQKAGPKFPVVDLNISDVDLNITDLDNTQMLSPETVRPKPLINDTLDDDSEIPCTPIPESQSIFMNTFKRTPTSNPKSPYKYTMKVKRTPETIRRKKLNLEKSLSSSTPSQHGPYSIDTKVLAIDDFLN